MDNQRCHAAALAEPLSRNSQRGSSSPPPFPRTPFSPCCLLPALTRKKEIQKLWLLMGRHPNGVADLSANHPLFDKLTSLVTPTAASLPQSDAIARPQNFKAYCSIQNGGAHRIICIARQSIMRSSAHGKWSAQRRIFFLADSITKQVVANPDFCQFTNADKNRLLKN